MEHNETIYLPDEIKYHLLDELTPAPNRGFFICPLCGSGTGTHGSQRKHRPTGALHLSRDKKHWRCFSCQESGDILDLVAKREHLSFPEARLALLDKYAPGWHAGKFGKVDAGNTAGFQEFGKNGKTQPLFQAYIGRCSQAFSGSPAEAYCFDRGISPDVCGQLGLGYDRDRQCLVVPYPQQDYYITRSLSGKEYRKPAGAQEPLFSVQAPGMAGDFGSAVLFVAEGQMDAVSLYQAGADLVVAAGGSGASRLSGIQEIFPGICRAVIVQDRDAAGKEAGMRFREALEGAGVCCFMGLPPEGCKDANDVLVEDEGRLVSLVQNWEAEARRMKMPAGSSPERPSGGAEEMVSPDNVREYLSGFFLAEMEGFRGFRDRKTGFSNIDGDTSLYPGLYMLGAESALGKTTFAHQLADQLAERGEHVLYFTLEQSKLELVSKGLSRLTARMGWEGGSCAPPFAGAVSAIDIRSGTVTAAVERAMDRYLSISGNEYLVECGFGTYCEDIRDYVEGYVARSGASPVVFIDYLQVLRSGAQNAWGKENVDACIRVLKKLQVKNGLALFVISSFNRSNYLQSVDFESFKESGDLEYTADVVWGMQLRAIRESGCGEKDGISQRRERLRAARLEMPRKVDVICLKNRHGKSAYSWGFDYYPEYDLFIPEEDPGCMGARKGKRRRI